MFGGRFGSETNPRPISQSERVVKRAAGWKTSLEAKRYSLSNSMINQTPPKDLDPLR